MLRRRTIASAAILAAFSLGAVAPANAAILGNPHGHAATVKAHAHTGHVSKQAVRQVLRDLAHLDKRLNRVARYPGVARLSAGDRDVVLANIAADQASLKTQADEVRAANTVADVRQARRDLKRVKPTNYILATNYLLNADRLNAEVAALSAQVQPGSAEETMLATASTQIAATATAARAITARSTRADLAVIRTTTNSIHALIDAVSLSVGTSTTTP
jgi:hypothetical protein